MREGGPIGLVFATLLLQNSAGFVFYPFARRFFPFKTSSTRSRDVSTLSRSVLPVREAFLPAHPIYSINLITKEELKKTNQSN